MRCKVYKKDFSHDSGYTIYEGEYSEIFTSYGDSAFNFSLRTASGERALNILNIGLKNRNSKTYEFGLLSQFDGEKILASRSLFKFLGKHLNLENTINELGQKGIGVAPYEFLSVRSKNYISSFDYHDKTRTLMTGGRIIGGSKTRLIDFPMPITALVTDIEISDSNKTLAQSDNPEEISLMRSISQCFDNVEHKLKSRFRVFKERTIDKSFLLRIPKNSYLVYIHTGEGQKFNNGLLLGWALPFVKKILLIYREGSLPVETLLLLERLVEAEGLDDELDASSAEFPIELRGFNNFEQERALIEKEVEYFLMINSHVN